MPLTVQAEVYDIGLASNAPTASDMFFLDTNVLLWMCYSKPSLLSSSYQINTYPGFIKRALQARCGLRTCGLVLAELAHQIELAEHNARPNRPAKLKDSRRDPAHRSIVANEIEAAWNSAMSFSTVIDVNVNANICTSMLAQFKSTALGGYDVIYADILLTNTPIMLVSDDSDFATLPNVQLFTANRNVLTSAGTQGKLRHR